MEHKRSKKQRLAGILLVTLCSAVLAGCNSSDSDKTTNGKTDAAKSAAKGTPGTGSSQQAD